MIKESRFLVLMPSAIGLSEYNNKNNNSSNNTGEKTIAAMGGDEADATAIT
jgi:hypothetical protein